MSSRIAKKAAGTFIEDSIQRLPTVNVWLTNECRTGSLAEVVALFCQEQPEILEQSLVIVESVTSDCIQCRIPCRCYDHEASGTFDADVQFELNPQLGTCRRF